MSIFYIVLGWIMILFGGALYVAQLISTVNFPLAQRLGIQEDPEASDSLLQRSERYTAYWDLVTLIWLPIAGLLMIFGHELWPIVAIIGGAFYFDSAGREAAKNLSFQHEGIKVGSDKQRRLFFLSYIMMAVIALVVIGVALMNL